MKTVTLIFPALAAASLMPLAAQTAPTQHHLAAAHHAVAHSTCVVLPELSPKIPALPSGLPCAHALYTLTRTPDVKADYISPLVSPEVRETLESSTATYSLAYVDVLNGAGELVKPNKFLTVKYTGYLSDGKKFDSSEDHPGKEPITFQYGMHHVIQGWDTGFEGMHVGGKRRVFIPYELAYGEAGRPPVIPAKSELVFDVEVVSQSDTEPKRTPPAPRPVPKPATPLPAAKPATPPAGANPATPPPAAKSATTPPASTTAPKQ